MVISELVDTFRLKKGSQGNIAPIQVRNNVINQIGDHSVRVLHPNKRGSEGYTESYTFGDVTLMVIDFGASVFIDLGKDKDYYIIDIPLRGTNHVDIEGKKFDVTPGFLSVTPPKKHAKFIQDSDCVLITVIIERKSLEGFLIGESNTLLVDPVEFRMLQSLEEGVSRSFLRTIMNTWQELKDTAAPLSNPVMARATGKQIIASLLTAIPNNYGEYLILAPERINTPLCILKAESYIVANLKEQISVHDLIEISGVSERSLFQNFKKYRGQSPMAYVRSLKLKMARKDLIGGNIQDTSVTNIALKWGFPNLGTFSSRYAKQFLEKPSETLRSCAAESMALEAFSAKEN